MFDKVSLANFIKSNSLKCKENARSYIFDCPNSNCNGKQKAYILKNCGQFCCFKCRETNNYKGTCDILLADITGMPRAQVCAIIYGSEAPQMDVLDLHFNDLWNDLPFQSYDYLFNLKETFWGPDHICIGRKSFTKGLNYLLSRGITEEQIIKYDIRYSPIEARVLFPIKINGKLIGWQDRYIYKTERVGLDGRVFKIPKAITSKHIGEQQLGGKLVMFHDNLLSSPHAVVAEGPVSALKAEKCGGNIATMGKAVTQDQIKLIMNYTNQIYLALDPDAAEDIVRIYNKNDCKFWLLLPPKGRGDLGECTQDEVYEQFVHAPRLNKGSLVFSLGGRIVF